MNTFDAIPAEDTQKNVFDTIPSDNAFDHIPAEPVAPATTSSKTDLPPQRIIEYGSPVASQPTNRGPGLPLTGELSKIPSDEMAKISAVDNQTPGQWLTTPLANLKPDSKTFLALQNAMATPVGAPPAVSHLSPTAEEVTQAEKLPSFQVQKGIARGVLGGAEFFTSPLGIATLGLGGLPVSAQRAIAGAFAIDMATQLPEQYRQLQSAVATKDAGQIAETSTQLGLTGLFSGMAAKHATSTTAPAFNPAIDRAAIDNLSIKDKPAEAVQPSQPPPMATLNDAIGQKLDEIKALIAQQKPPETAQPVAEQPLNTGGSEAALPPDKQALSKQNNSREAFEALAKATKGATPLPTLQSEPAAKFSEVLASKKDAESSPRNPKSLEVVQKGLGDTAYWQIVDHERGDTIANYGSKKLADEALHEMSGSRTIDVQSSEVKSLPKKFRIGNSPQTHEIVERLPQSETEKANGEQPVKVKNDRTGEVQTVTESDLTPVKARTAEEKTATAKPLDDQLREAGLDPSVFPNRKSKQAALTRSKAVGMGGATPEEFPEPGNTEIAGADVEGVAARVRESQAKAGVVEPVEPGEGIAPEASVEKGRELLNNGADPEAIMQDFEKSNKLSGNDMAVARAHAEQLAKAARSTEEQFGTDSPQYKVAFDARTAWAKRTKAMQTEWHRTGMAQQGETDIDTGSFTGLRSAHVDTTGKDFTPPQATEAKRVAGKVKQAKEEANASTKKLSDAIDAERKALAAASRTVRNNAVKQAKEEAKETNKTVKDKILEAIKGYLDAGELDLGDIREKVSTDLGLTAKQFNQELSRTQGVNRAIDEVWRKQKASRQIQQQAKDWLKTVNTPRLERFLSAIPRAMFGLRVGGGLHGTVALGTHAPFVLYQPRYWANYIRNFAKMYRMVFSNANYESAVQELVRDKNYDVARRAGLVNDPVKNEEFQDSKVAAYMNKLTGPGERGYAVLKMLRQDMFNQQWDKLPATSKSPKMAEQIADAINHVTGVVRSGDRNQNNLVGKLATSPNVFFAPKLMASRAAWLYGDPAKAAVTFSNWKNATIEDKYFAINQVKEKAWVAGTYLTMLAMNQGVLNAVGSDQKINGVPKLLGGAGFDPMRSDFMKFKVAGMDVSYGNAMFNMARLPLRLIEARSHGEKGKRTRVFPDESAYTALGEFGRSQLSPFASMTADLTLGQDFQRRPLPNSNAPVPKRLAEKGVKPYTWTEYATEQALPIPAQEAAKEVFRHGFGTHGDDTEIYLKAFLTIATQAATGTRVTEDYELKKHGK